MAGEHFSEASSTELGDPKPTSVPPECTTLPRALPAGGRKRRPLRTHRNIGRFLVDSDPAFWFVCEGILAWAFFLLFSTLGKGLEFAATREINDKGALIYGLCFAFLGLGLGLFERENRFKKVISLQLLVMTGLLAAVLGLFILYFVEFRTVGRLSLLYGTLGSMLATYISIHYSGALLIKHFPHRFIFLAGPSPVGAKIVEVIGEKGFRQYEYARSIESRISQALKPSDDHDERRLTDQVDGRLDDLVVALREESVSEIVVDFEQRHHIEHSEFLFAALRQGIRVVEESEYFAEITRRLPLEIIPDSHVFRMGFDIHRPIPNFFKRGFDFVMALSLLIFLLPLFVLIATAIKFDSPGPILFFQKRVGRFGVPFYVVKFRTMQVNSEAHSHSTARQDARITGFGSLLRRTHFDELPQLWNIFLGQMSLVGPRPEAAQIVERMCRQSSVFSLRHIVRPGLTGLAQVSQGKTTDAAAEMKLKLSYDLYYIRHFNLFFDFWIISRTAFRLMQSTW